MSTNTHVYPTVKIKIIILNTTKKKNEWVDFQILVFLFTKWTIFFPNKIWLGSSFEIY